MVEPTISYPFGEMDQQNIDYATDIELLVKNQKTLSEVADLTGDVNLTAKPEHDLDAGAELIVKLKADATGRTVTLSTGFSGLPISVTASKTVYLVFVFDGTSFILLSENQID